MNSRLRPHWVALAAAALLVALSVSSALGADPADDADKNHGQQVSDFVHSLLFGNPASDDEDAPAEDVQDEEEPVDEESADEVDTADVDPASGQPDNHGACVSAVAMSDEVGGDQENHGGAVSEAARVTCWDDADGEGEDTEVTSATEEHGNSANAHNKPHGHGRGHGRGGS